MQTWYLKWTLDAIKDVSHYTCMRVLGNKLSKLNVHTTLYLGQAQLIEAFPCEGQGRQL